ncbi:transcription factor domain-containing protein [Truncatella angustata]|uniref:Transcription factor domain-containing protein n=1 Tax=Truncatella angustata TaxID=152316 RepID=A0A9P8UHF2_9PEZI|nr:transcription factor domain-containing protein [Truncatella angustata]KAH6652255.1 transcription factor domain-containing protein [Truncatella angustata]
MYTPPTNMRYFSTVLLCCIIALASRYSDGPEVRSDPQDPNTAGMVFLEHAEALIHYDLKWPSITTVPCLAIMATIYVAIGSDAAGWLHHGMAARLIIDMGLNIDASSVDGSTCLSTQDIRLRRQIYWTFYCSDKLFASYTGLVCTMLEFQGSIPLPEPFVSDEGPPGKTPNAVSKSTFLACLHRLFSTQCQISESILKGF